MVAIEALELWHRPTTCLKFPALKAGTSESHRLRLRMVSRVRYTYRSMAMATPTTNIKASGYRNIPPSLKKLTAEFMKFICALLDKLSISRICDSTRFRKIGYDLLLTLVRRAARCTILGRIGLHGLVIDDFAFEYVPVDRGQDLIDQAVHRFTGQIPDIGLLPGDDIHDLGLLPIARHGGGAQFQAIRGSRRLLTRSRIGASAGGGCRLCGGGAGVGGRGRG